MTSPKEKPVIETWPTRPSVGVKQVMMAKGVAQSYIDGLAANGVKAHMTPDGGGLYLVVIDKL